MTACLAPSGLLNCEVGADSQRRAEGPASRIHRFDLNSMPAGLDVGEGGRGLADPLVGAVENVMEGIAAQPADLDLDPDRANRYDLVLSGPDHPQRGPVPAGLGSDPAAATTERYHDDDARGQKTDQDRWSALTDIRAARR